MEANITIEGKLDHLFRQEFGKMVAVLVKIFGTEHYQIAEDVVQDALIKALETWKFKGIPTNPRAWLYRVAKNKAIDIIRRRRHSVNFDFSSPEKQLLNSEYTLVTAMDNFWEEHQIEDDFLAMMFACCLADISIENQIAFILKSLCGFSTKEIAKAFLTSEDTISKRIYRTKQFFRTNKIIPEIPKSEKLYSRTRTVLNVIYMMFNEGYNSTHHKELIRKDIILQAITLCKALAENKKTQIPEVFALMALICFHAARIESRLSTEGDLLLLSEQDRNTWNIELIQTGNEYLNRSAVGERISAYHLEAAIAYEHCTAKDYQSTNWYAILGYYDTMLSRSFDPIIFLNRSIVIMEIEGPEKALNVLTSLGLNKHLENYYLYHAILGELHRRLGQKSKAAGFFKSAHELTQSAHEKRFLEMKLSVLK